MTALQVYIPGSLVLPRLLACLLACSVQLPWLQLLCLQGLSHSHLQRLQLETSGLQLQGFSFFLIFSSWHLTEISSGQALH